jgi:hypothetical protein
MSKQAAVPAQPQVTPVASGGLLQRACACGQHHLGGGECESCKRKRQSQAGGLQVQFSATSRQPASSTRLDRETLPDFSRIPAHRMPNSIQARGGLGRRVAEDEDVATGSGQLAAATPNPPVVARQLTPQEMQEAITYNRYRFKDPYSLRVIRQRLGIAPVPAVVDEDFVRSIVQWQADHGLDQDGKVGPGTTASLTMLSSFDWIISPVGPPLSGRPTRTVQRRNRVSTGKSPGIPRFGAASSFNASTTPGMGPAATGPQCRLEVPRAIGKHGGWTTPET